jgi:hypothetical protein
LGGIQGQVFHDPPPSISVHRVVYENIWIMTGVRDGEGRRSESRVKWGERMLTSADQIVLDYNRHLN